MTLHFSTSRAIGAAIALTLGSVATATAQDTTRTRTPVRKDVPATPSTGRMPVTKDTPQPAPTPAPMSMPTSAPMPMADSSSSSTTTTTTTTTSMSTTEMPMAPMRKFGNGFYIGVAGATAFPQNRLNDFYRSGYGAEVPIGWDPMNSPIGLRLNLGYMQLRSDDDLAFSRPLTPAGLKNPQIYQAVADAKLRLPFGRLLGSTSGLYAVGGGGVYYFRNYQRSLALTTNTTNTRNVTGTFSDEDATNFGGNVGGGISFGVGPASLYLESRYVRIFTDRNHSDYVPVVLGLTFHQ